MDRPTSLADLDAYVERLARERNRYLLESDQYNQQLFGEELRLQKLARDLDKREESLNYREGWMKNKYQALRRQEGQLEAAKEAVQGRSAVMREKEAKLDALEVFMDEEEETHLTSMLGHTPTLKDVRAYYRTLFDKNFKIQQEPATACEHKSASGSTRSSRMPDSPLQTTPTAPTDTALVPALESTDPPFTRYPLAPLDATGVPFPYPPLHPRKGQAIPNYNPNSFDPANNPWAPNPRLYFD